MQRKTNNANIKEKIEALEEVIENAEKNKQNTRNNRNKSSLSGIKTIFNRGNISDQDNSESILMSHDRRKINKNQRITQNTRPKWRNNPLGIIKPDRIGQNTLVFSTTNNIEKIKKNVRDYPSGDCSIYSSDKKYQIPSNVKYKEFPQSVISGGYGEVYKAEWTTIDTNNQVKTREVAIKHFRNVKEFQYEMGIVEKIGELQIDSFIQWIAADSEKNIIVYEWLDTDYHEYVKKYQEIPPAYWLLTMYKLVYGLYEIHSKNMIHRDIKPENLLCKISNPFYIKYGDLGSCCVCNNPKICRSKSLYGTSYFINRAKSSNLFKRDIFALGLSLYEIFTGNTIPNEYRMNLNKQNNKIIKKITNKITNKINNKITNKINNKENNKINLLKFIQQNNTNNSKEEYGIISPIELDRIEYRLNNQIMNIGTYIRWMLDPLEDRRPTAKELIRRMIRDYPDIFSKLR
jgi:hypothetical protein